jgi:hypothetical protein
VRERERERERESERERERERERFKAVVSVLRPPKPNSGIEFKIVVVAFFLPFLNKKVLDR